MTRNWAFWRSGIARNHSIVAVSDWLLQGVIGIAWVFAWPHRALLSRVPEADSVQGNMDQAEKDFDLLEPIEQARMVGNRVASDLRTYRGNPQPTRLMIDRPFITPLVRVIQANRQDVFGPLPMVAFFAVLHGHVDITLPPAEREVFLGAIEAGLLELDKLEATAAAQDAGILLPSGQTLH